MEGTDRANTVATTPTPRESPRSSHNFWRADTSGRTNGWYTSLTKTTAIELR